MAEKNQKRNDILTSARALFSERGFHDTKMEDIAQGAGVGKGTLYEYFKNKQDIFDETCIEYLRTITEDVNRIGNMDISFREKLIMLFNERNNTIDDVFDKNPVDYIMSYKNIISEKTLITMFACVSEINSVIIDMIEGGKNEGVVKKDIPSDIIACCIVGTMGEYFNLKKNKKDYTFNDDDIIFNLLFDGFGVK
ncbi:MAG TPA: hypothetical protein DEF04_12110 [Clostridiales bacterium]|nr:hypothetical protein [Clostridiales bacterium]